MPLSDSVKLLRAFLNSICCFLWLYVGYNYILHKSYVIN